MNKLIAMCIIAVLLCAFTPEKNTKMNNIESNKALIIKCYQSLFGQTTIEFAKSIIADNYIQHNPMVKDGKAGFLEFLDRLKQLPKPGNQQKPFMRLIADSNFVAVHSKVEFMGQMRATIDLYRIEANMLTEHWDASEIIPDESKNGNSMVEGTNEITNTLKTNQNSLLVAEFFKKVILEKQIKLASNYISEKLIQHSPDTENGRDAFIEQLNSIHFLEIHKQLTEGNFVLAQTKAIINAKDHVLYFIFRLENNLIIESWNVKQEMPQQMAHTNGML